MKELIQMVKRRKLVASSPTTQVSSHLGALTNTMSRNPFRKKNNPDSENTSAQRFSAGAPLISPLETVSTASGTNSTTSSHAIPAKATLTWMPTLPEELRRSQTKSQTYSERRQPSTEVGGPPTNRTHESAVRKSKPIQSQSKPRSQGPLPTLFNSAADSRTSQRPQISTKPSKSGILKNKSKCQRATATFDWKGWGSKY